MKPIQKSLFTTENEQQAITNIQKFAKLAEKMGLIVEVGFSGGKDSIVTLDLVKRSGIDFVAIFNYAFESPEVLHFIKCRYPQVIIQRKEKSYYQLIREKKFLPTQQIRFCCDYFKENSKNATIVGVRRSESQARKTRKTFKASKSFLRKNKDFSEFSIECTEIYKGEIQLKPIVYWNDYQIWEYIKIHELPYPKIYSEGQKRCGCMMCPLATLNTNLFYFKKYPNLIKFSKHLPAFLDLKISKTGKKYTSEQFLFIWLNRFKEPSEKQKKIINQIYKRNIFEL